MNREEENSVRFETIRKRISSMRKEYLWIIIILLFAGHLAWLTWVLVTDFYLIPRATINQKQYDQFEREVEFKNKFTPSYSFYDNWGNLTGRLDMSEMDMEFTAEVRKTGETNEIRIFSTKDGTKKLIHTINDYDFEDINKVSWSDIVVSMGNDEFGILDINEEGDSQIIVYNKVGEMKYSFGLGSKGNTVRAFLYRDGDLYYIYSPKEEIHEIQDYPINVRTITQVDIERGRRENIFAKESIYSEPFTEESDKYLSDVRLSGVFFDKYLVYEKAFHIGNTFNYSQIAIDVESGKKSDIFQAETVKGIYE